MVAGCTWVRWTGPTAADPTCQRAFIEKSLDTDPRPALGWFSRELGFFTTPFKRRGISGWRETYCIGHADGTLVRDAQHSTDGFWTIDIQIQSLTIDGSPSTAADGAHPVFICIEVEPRTVAHSLCSALVPRKGDLLTVGGVIVIDTDADFLEIHPTADFQIRKAQ